MEEVSSTHLDSDSDDQEILCLLDAADELLLRHAELGQKLSHGWINIAAARYAMGPSRICQSLFSLKPCPSTAGVFVTPEGEDQNGIRSRLLFRIRKAGVGDETTVSDEDKPSESTSLSGLRHRHSPGLEASKSHTTNGNMILEDDQKEDPRRTKTVKQPSESLAWFGVLVSPHLRAAQSSFAEALETLVELATLQSTILATIEKLKNAGLI